MSEHDTPGSESVQLWRLRTIGDRASGRLQTGIATEVVGTGCVERDQEDIGLGWRGGGARGLFAPPAACGQNHQKANRAGSQTPQQTPKKARFNHVALLKHSEGLPQKAQPLQSSLQSSGDAYTLLNGRVLPPPSRLENQATR